MNTTQAASLPILTNSDSWPLSPDGRPTLASGCIPQLLDKEGRLRPQKGYSLHVINGVRARG